MTGIGITGVAGVLPDGDGVVSKYSDEDEPACRISVG